MSAPNPVAICNRALTLVGGNTITSFLDGTNEAKICNIHYEQVRDSVTADNQWTHSFRRFGPLTPEPTAPAYGFSYSYLLPTDLLMLLWAGTDPRGVIELSNYAVENNRLLADVGAGISIQYTARVTDTTKFVQPYTEVLVARLAAEIAMPLTESRTLQQQMFQLYSGKLSEALAADGLQGRNQPTTATRARRARYAFGGSGRDFYSWG